MTHQCLNKFFVIMIRKLNKRECLLAKNNCLLNEYPITQMFVKDDIFVRNQVYYGFTTKMLKCLQFDFLLIVCYPKILLNGPLLNKVLFIL